MRTHFWTRSALMLCVLAVPVYGSAKARRQTAPPPAPAPATTPPPAPAPNATPAPSPNATSAAAGADFVITAERQVPDSFTLSTRSPLGYRLFEQPVRSIQEILNAVKRPPF